jgi:hypothetical protein
MEISGVKWQIAADQETFEKCQQDEKFRFIVALARSTNAINSVNSMMLRGGEDLSPRATRDRLNAYLVASALFYEILKLIRRMNSAFRSDELFQKGLRLILKDPTARQIERAHLNRMRHNAVFHFEPDTFAEIIAKSTCETCIFARGQGTNKDRCRLFLSGCYCR